MIDEHDAAWRQWFTTFGVHPDPVRYKDLVADMAGGTESILRFLDIPTLTGRTLTAGHHRQVDEIKDDWIVPTALGPQPGSARRSSIFRENRTD